MIYLIMLFSSLLIQFGTFTFPTRYDDVNLKYQSVTDRLYNDIQNRGFKFDKKYCLIVGNTNNSYGVGYEVFVPVEVLNGNNSSINVTYRVEYNNYGHIDTSNSGWIRFKYGTSYNFLFGGYNETVSSLSFDVITVDYNGSGLLYNEYYVLPYQDINSFNFEYVPQISGHTQNGKNEHVNTPLPFPNAPSIIGHSSVNTVDDSNTNNLLGNILNSIQYGSNLIVNGLNNLGHFLGNLWGNINSTINYVIAPVDSAEFVDIVGHSSFAATYTNLQELKNSFVNMSPKDGVPIEFTLPESLGGGEYSFNLATYLNGTKRIWQPLLLIFLYASAVWGLYRSLPNFATGISPGADYVRGAYWHLYQPPVEIRTKDKKL